MLHLFHSSVCPSWGFECVCVCPCLQRLKPGSDQEENELVILHLRQLCETKQKSHLHIGEAPQVNIQFDSKGLCWHGNVGIQCQNKCDMKTVT